MGGVNQTHSTMKTLTQSLKLFILFCIAFSFQHSFAQVQNQANNFSYTFNCDSANELLTYFEVIDTTTNYHWEIRDSSDVLLVKNDQSNFNLELQAGVYFVSLNGESDTLKVPQKAKANFTYEPKIICEGMPVYFTDQSLGDIISWEWDFGDYSSSLLQNAQRTYTSTSSTQMPINIVVTVKDKYGCISQDLEVFTVTPDNLHQVIYMDTVIVNNDLMSIDLEVKTDFNGFSTKPISYSWNTGDTVSRIRITKPGEYIVEMKDKYNCSETAKTTVIFPKIPLAEINIDSISKKDSYLALSCKKGAKQTYTWYQKTKNKWQQLEEKSNELEMKDLKRKVNEFKVEVCSQNVGIPKCCKTSDIIKIKLKNNNFKTRLETQRVLNLVLINGHFDQREKSHLN